jgi:hypothetical protein
VSLHDATLLATQVAGMDPATAKLVMEGFCDALRPQWQAEAELALSIIASDTPIQEA